MKKVKWYSLVVVLGLMTLMYFSCERTSPNSLRIVSINGNSPLNVDVRDWYVVSVDTSYDPPETTFDYVVKDWIVPMEISYVETGIGLPTYPTPYTARCTSYTVIFRRIDRQSVWRPNNVTGAANIIIESNPTGKTVVKTSLNLIPSEWIQLYQDTLAPTLDPTIPSVSPEAVVKATVIINGYEELTRNAVVDTGYLTINFADYYDNVVSVGSK